MFTEQLGMNQYSSITGFIKCPNCNLTVTSTLTSPDLSPHSSLLVFVAGKTGTEPATSAVTETVGNRKLLIVGVSVAPKST